MCNRKPKKTNETLTVNVNNVSLKKSKEKKLSLTFEWRPIPRSRSPIKKK